MKILRIVQRPVAAALATMMLLVSLPMAPAQAAIVGTDQVLTSPDTARDRVASFMTRQDVRDELTALGISPEEAASRVQALSDAEIAQIAGKIDTLPAGEGVGAIVGAIVLVFIILLITDLVGLTDVFGFTKKGALNPN
tara:strand:+ start:377 stop:793 length:417 start_codon:yes stop_codon:yes gene_type:complete